MGPVVGGAERQERVAFIGLGRMGRPMAANIARAGLLVAVHDRDTSVMESFAREHDVRIGLDPADVAHGATVVITMLPDVSVTSEGLTGPAGVLRSLSPGSLVIDMGTAPPSRSRELAAAVARAGSLFLDAPVSGSVRTSTEGRLTVMVGGDLQVVARARPVLDTMAEEVHHPGASATPA